MSCGFTTGSVSLQLAEKTENRKKNREGRRKRHSQKDSFHKRSKGSKKYLQKKNIFDLRTLPR